MYVFSLYACIYRKPGRFPFYKSCHVYCNKPIPPSFYKQGNRHLKLQSKMTVSRGHTFFFPYYTCNLSLRVKIPPWHLYCLWLSYVHPLKRGFQKEISRGCKNALSGSQVSCRPGWPLGNQSHSWHFRAAAKPLGNTLTQRPRFAAVMWDAQTGNRTCPKGQEPSDKIRGGTWLPSCQGGNGHEGPCLYALTTQRKGGQLNVYKCHITYVTGQRSSAGLLPTRVCYSCSPEGVWSPRTLPHITGPITPKGCRKALTVVDLNLNCKCRDGVFHLSKLQFYQQHRKHW